MWEPPETASTNHEMGSAAPAAWQATHRSELLPELQIWAWFALKPPGARNSVRFGVQMPNSKMPVTTATEQTTKIFRLLRRFRLGTHPILGVQQLPLGSGPVSQAPPWTCERLHFQLLSCRTGVHCNLPGQRPSLVGPPGQPHPSVLVQIQFRLGRL